MKNQKAMNGTEKQWMNRWICNPKYQNLVPLKLLHKQLDTEFQIPKHREDLKNNHTLFRKRVELSPGVKQVILDISADDYYKLYVNGQYVTQGPANSYAFCYNYNKIDITGFVKPGENVLAVHVYYQGLVNRAYNSGDYRQGMIAELWADGVQLIDDSWRYTEAKEYGFTRTIAYDTQFDEVIDNRRKHTGWKEIEYDDSSWEMAAICENDDHALVLQTTRNLEMEHRLPVVIRKLENGYLLDFGEELTGTFYMKAKGCQGDEVTIWFGEELLTDTQVRYELRCNCLYEDKLILEEGENELEQFEYKCFRYVQLTMKQAVRDGNIQDSLKLYDFRVDYRHYPFDDSVCSFHSENELVNQIWSICKNAVRNCAQESFVDCPQREKGQYLGDLTVTAHSFYCLTGDSALFRKALIDFAHSTVICEGMMAVAPGSFMQEIADFSLMYAYQLLLYYQCSKDETLLRRLLPVAEGIERYFDRFQNETGMIENVNTKWNLVDWPDNLRDNYDFDLPQPVVGEGCHNVINALYVGMKKCMEEIRKILGITQKPQFEKLREAFIQSFYCQKTGLFVDSTVSTHSSLHSNTFSAFYGLQPEGNRIAELIRQKKLCCGVFVSYFVLYALLNMGETELAYELITNKTEHSWYHMIQEGATTAFEAWGKEQKWNTSLCHAWASAPIPVLMDLQKVSWK